MTPPKQTEAPEPTSPSFLQQLEAKSSKAIGNLLKMEHKTESERLTTLTPEQYQQIQEIESGAIARFSGDLTQLEAALGMLRMGHFYGWKVLYLMHSKRTIRNYEAILEIKVREVFPEEGPHTYRSIGLAIAKLFTNFWKVAGGDIKIPHKQETL